MMGEYVNLFVSATNLIGLFTFIQVYLLSDKSIVLLAMIASTLMHLSEQKHNLPGIFPFNKYTWYFLQFDRFVSYALSIYVFYRWTFSRNLFSLTVGLFGICCNIISERSYVHNWVWFTIWHSVWHFCAFFTMYLIL